MPMIGDYRASRRYLRLFWIKTPILVYSNTIGKLPKCEPQKKGVQRLIRVITEQMLAYIEARYGEAAVQ